MINRSVLFFLVALHAGLSVTALVALRLYYQKIQHLTSFIGSTTPLLSYVNNPRLFRRQKI